jgi:hypothetical protein
VSAFRCEMRCAVLHSADDRLVQSFLRSGEAEDRDSALVHEVKTAMYMYEMSQQDVAEQSKFAGGQVALSSWLANKKLTKVWRFSLLELL